MTSTELPWRIRDRALRPFAFAVSLATAVLAAAIATNTAVGSLLDGAPGHIVGLAAGAAVIALWAGWWSSNDHWMRLGLFLTTGVWSAAATILAIDIGVINVNTALSACWALAAGGAWLLEAANPRRPRGPGE